MKKLVATMFMAVAIVATLCACGEQTEQLVDNNTTATVAPTKETEPTAAPEPTATAVPTEEPTAEPTKAVEPTATAVPTEEPTAEPTATPTPEPTATPEPTKAPTPEPTATPEPTKAPTPEPTKEPEKLADKNGCSDVVTAQDYTSDTGTLKIKESYLDAKLTLHKSGLKYYEDGKEPLAIFGSSLYDRQGYENRPNPCKYFIMYECKGESTDEYTSFEVLANRLLGYNKHEVYDYNGIQIFVKTVAYEEDKEYEIPACVEYNIVQDIGVGYYIHIDVTSYDVTEDIDTVLGRVLLLEGDYTVNQ